MQLRYLRNKIEQHIVMMASAATLVFVAMLDPNLAYGRSVGLFWSLSILALIVGSVVFCEMVLSRFVKDELRLYLTTTIFSAALVVALFAAADNDYEINKKITSAKIEYFCSDNFKPKTCVLLVNSCPECALDIPKWRRQKAVANLKTAAKLIK